MTVYVNVADFKLGCQKGGLLTASAPSISLQVCVRAAIFNSTLGSGRLFVDSHCDLRHFLAWSLPALLREITAHPPGTVGQKVHPSPSCPVADWCKPLLSTVWMQGPRL